jgi:HlyD family secretion protein
VAVESQTADKDAFKANTPVHLKPKLNKKKILALLGVVTVILIAIALYTKSAAPTEVKTVPVTKGDIDIYVSAPAKVKLSSRAELNFKTPGKIAQVYVKKGDTVVAGDILAELDMKSVYPQITQAQAGLKSARAGLDKLLSGKSKKAVAITEASVRNASTAVKNAEKNLKTARKIVEQSKKKAGLNETNAKYALNSAKEQLNKTKNSLRGEEVMLARMKRDQAAQAYDDASASYGKAQNTADAAYDSAQQTVTNAKASLDAYTDANPADTTTTTYYTYKSGYESAQKALEVTDATNEQTLQASQAQLNQAEKAYSAALVQYELTAKGARSEDIAVAENQVKQAEIALEIAKMGSDDATLDSQLDAAQSQLDTAMGSSSVAIAQLELDKEGPLAADVKAAQAQIEQAQGALESAQLISEDQVLKAPFAGKVASVNGKKGEIAGANAAQGALITLLNFDRIELTADVDETDVSKLKVGQDVHVTLDAFENKVFNGKLNNISLLSAKNATGGTIFEVTVIINPTKETLREGMTGDVDIIVDSKKAALTVPFEAVKMEGDKSSVLVVEKGAAKLKTIKTGLASDISYEVKSGLKLGDVIIIEKGDIKDGQSVKAKDDGRIGR